MSFDLKKQIRLTLKDAETVNDYAGAVIVRETILMQIKMLAGEAVEMAENLDKLRKEFARLSEFADKAVMN